MAKNRVRYNDKARRHQRGDRPAVSAATRAAASIAPSTEDADGVGVVDTNVVDTNVAVLPSSARRLVEVAAPAAQAKKMSAKQRKRMEKFIVPYR